MITIKITKTGSAAEQKQQRENSSAHSNGSARTRSTAHQQQDRSAGAGASEASSGYAKPARPQGASQHMHQRRPQQEPQIPPAPDPVSVCSHGWILVVIKCTAHACEQASVFTPLRHAQHRCQGCHGLPSFYLRLSSLNVWRSAKFNTDCFFGTC